MILNPHPLFPQGDQENKSTLRGGGYTKLRARSDTLPGRSASWNGNDSDVSPPFSVPQITCTTTSTAPSIVLPHWVCRGPRRPGSRGPSGPTVGSHSLVLGGAPVRPREPVLAWGWPPRQLQCPREDTGSGGSPSCQVLGRCVECIPSWGQDSVGADKCQQPPTWNVISSSTTILSTVVEKEGLLNVEAFAD